VGQNFLVGSKINELAELCKKGVIEIFLTDITYKEIIARFRKNLVETKENIIKPRNILETHAKLLRNFSELNAFFNLPTVDIEDLCLKFQNDFDKWLKNNNAVTISTGHITIKEVFEDYFDNNPPFKEGIKKNEFPDAFTLKALVEYFSKIKSKSYILSSDKDLLTFGSKILIPIENASDLFDMVIRATPEILEKKALKLIEKEFMISKAFLGKETKKQIVRVIEAEIESTYQIDDMDVDSGELIEISDIELEEFSIVSLNTSSNSAKLECEVNFSFEVSFNVDDYSEASYDREDDKWYYVETRTYIIKGSYDIAVTISANFNFDDKFAELEVEEINHGMNLDIIGRFGE